MKMAQIINFPKSDDHAPITFTNFKDQVYYLHEGKTKTGKAKYHFSMKSEGILAKSIPDGFEIYENPNGQVFCRKIPLKIITDEEIEIVKSGMEKYSDIKNFKVDVKKGEIMIYTSNNDEINRVEEILGGSSMAPLDDQRRKLLIASMIYYASDMKFTLVDKKSRDFIVQRYNYRGSIDDWMPISGGRGLLDQLVAEYVIHLGKDSFFALY